MFTSATVKLTGWYLFILMTISVIFSVVIYNIASNEVNDRLRQLQTNIQNAPFPVEVPERFNYAALRNAQYEAANQNLAWRLVYANIVILIASGAGSYFLARRTLRPIEEAHEAQTRFVSDASHELKTPLSVMKTELEVALRDPNLSQQEAREIIESNLEEVNKLAALSATLLQLSQLDYGELETKPIQLSDITRAVVKKYDKTGTRIDLTAPKSLTIQANKTSIEELVTIMVDNALKYSPNTTVVKVKLSKYGKQAMLTIINSGSGISAEDMPFIFDRFYRADTARTRNAKIDGHGLGLSLAKRLVELHQGELSVSSAPDHETTFTILLPLAESQANLK